MKIKMWIIAATKYSEKFENQMKKIIKNKFFEESVEGFTLVSLMNKAVS